jgi:hypothetical protein
MDHVYRPGDVTNDGDAVYRIPIPPSTAAAYRLHLVLGARSVLSRTVEVQPGTTFGRPSVRVATWPADTPWDEVRRLAAAHVAAAAEVDPTAIVWVGGLDEEDQPALFAHRRT